MLLLIYQQTLHGETLSTTLNDAEKIQKLHLVPVYFGDITHLDLTSKDHLALRPSNCFLELLSSLEIFVRR